jgi:hypothetical protein
MVLDSFCRERLCIEIDFHLEGLAVVSRIEKVEGGVVVQTAERHTDGLYYCHLQGQTMFPTKFGNLDDAADFLITNRRSRIRMNPGWSLIVDHIHIDGRARETLP